MSFNEELTALWKAVVKRHYNYQISIDKPRLLDIDSFRLHLWDDIRLSAHDRYAAAWTCTNNNKTTIIPIRLDPEE
jgi:hypothetical protein